MNNEYSASKGFVFIFNLIVGAGALNIPQAFNRAGLILGVIVLSILAFTSYVTATFMVELMAGVNTLILKRKSKEILVSPSGASSELTEKSMESVGLLELDQVSTVQSEFRIAQKIEMAQMAEELLSTGGLIMFYLCVIIYLYGDLAIYATAVPKSLREITCPSSANKTQPWDCRGGFNSTQVYRMYVIVFAACLGPFVFGNLQKTQLMQILTTAMRHVSFLLMILISIGGIVHGSGRKFSQVVEYENPAAIPTLFGVCIYSFMCHHSLPGLITPIHNKDKVGRVLLSSVAVVLGVYLMLCTTASFRFKPSEIQDVYTLNFKSFDVRLIAMFLGLFPVFTLSTNFPLIAITLRENLVTLFTKHRTAPRMDSLDMDRPTESRHRYALLAIAPPIAIALCTENVSMLVGFTGSYAGLGIQWFIPAVLVKRLRERLNKLGYTDGQNLHRSPFYGPFWLNFTLAFATIALTVVTATHLFN